MLNIGLNQGESREAHRNTATVSVVRNTLCESFQTLDFNLDFSAMAGQEVGEFLSLANIRKMDERTAYMTG